MGLKPTTVQNNFTNGEISPAALGRFDIAKYSNSAKYIENFLIKQLGGVMFRPGTTFVAETKTSSLRSRLLKFQYSVEQNYVIEAGNLYFRFYTDSGQLVDLADDPVEVTTVYPTAILPYIKYAQNADVMYITTGDYPVYKLQRTSATTFTMTKVAFKRGPFLDTNVTSTTITASADTGAGITLTASSAIFDADHVDSLWRVKDGVVKITAYSSTTSVTGTVQDEPDGTAGNLGTSAAATDDWAEGAWSAYRGYPKAVTFHEGRLYFANTDYEVSGVWGSVPFAYENFDEGEGNDDDAINIELNADTVVAIYWLSSAPKSLQAGTTGGLFNINGGNSPITPTNINAPRDNLFGTADVQGKRMWNYVYYVQNDLQRFLESGYFFEIDSNDAIDTTILADHILGVHPETSPFPRGSDSNPGAYEMDSQQSPNNRIWVVRNDGQLCVLTRNPRQEINGWCRFKAGETVSCDGESGTGQFESIAIIPQEGDYDQVWVIVNRIIDGTSYRFVEYFSSEDFKYEWEPVRLDCSLTYDSPFTITDISFTSTTATITTLTAHGLSNGDTVQLDNIVGTYQLNGEQFEVSGVTTYTFDIDITGLV